MAVVLSKQEDMHGLKLNLSPSLSESESEFIDFFCVFDKAQLKKFDFKLQKKLIVYSTV